MVREISLLHALMRQPLLRRRESAWIRGITPMILAVILSLCLFFYILPKDEDAISPVVVVINGFDYRTPAIESAFRSYLESLVIGEGISRKTVIEAEDLFVRSFIESAVLDQKVKEAKIAVSADEAELLMRSVEMRHDDNRDETEAPAGEIRSDDDLQKTIRFLGRMKLLDRIVSETQISELDKTEYYFAHSDEFFHPELASLRILLFRKSWLARQAKMSLTKGYDFIKVANETSRSKNCDYIEACVKPRNKWVEELGEEVFQLDRGYHSDIIRTDDGNYLIVQVVDVIPAGVSPYFQVVRQVEELALEEKRKQAVSEYMKRVLSEARILIDWKRMRGTIDAAVEDRENEDGNEKQNG